ncbi:MAG: hypothetical protein GTN37_04030 [Candidatus Aenigmarchaeota archaeon]|nr:hypothetical protein [Candidatus Aenigmarchaeota archaeon]NIQ17975.1 hypothetical protein [Candidatus Aenigmarchaeota archaeon]NIS73564.1 hypothetical protein [Candidatus Aenigmarchaeota archaeon]
MKIFNYEGFIISTDSSCVDNEILEKRPYTFHLGDDGVLYIMKSLDPTLTSFFEHPLKVIKVTNKEAIRSIIDKYRLLIDAKVADSSEL